MLLDNGNGLPVLPLLESLSTAHDDVQSALEGELGLLGYDVIGLVVNSTTFRVPKNNPVDARVDKLSRGRLASVGPRDMERAVLGCKLDSRTGGEGRFQGNKIDVGRGDYDLYNTAKVSS